MMMMQQIQRKIVLLAGLLGLMAFAAPLRAQDLSITANIDRSEIAIGERALLTIKVRSEDAEHTNLLIPSDLLPTSDLVEASIVVLQSQASDTVSIDSRIKEITRETIFTSFGEGLVKIPPIGVSLEGKEVYTEPIYIKVIAPKVDMEHPEQFYPIKPTWSLPYSFLEIVLLALPWLVGIMLLAGLILGVRYLRKRRKFKKSENATSEPRLSDYELLCRHLQELDFDLPDAEYYTQLDLIFREYLAQGIIPKVMEMTTSQMQNALKVKGVLDEKESCRAASELFLRFILSKFARENYSRTQREDDCEAIRLLAKHIEENHSFPQPTQNPPQVS